MPVWLKSVAGAVVAAGLAAFGQEIALGQVPIPADFAWLAPIVVAMISALTPHLRGQNDQPPPPRG